jgi:hypothetical protein
LGDVGSTHGRHCSSGDAVIFSRCSAGVDGWVNFNSLLDRLFDAPQDAVTQGDFGLAKHAWQVGVPA